MFEDHPTFTIPEFLCRTIAQRRDQPALGFIRDGQLRWRTWGEVIISATHLAVVLENIGVHRGDCIAHVSENRYEWVVTDLALHLAGAVHVPIHVTLSGQQIAEQIADCGARVVFVSTHDLLARFHDHVDSKTQIVVYEGAVDSQSKNVASLQSLTSVYPRPKSVDDGPKEDDRATILYTSGTTGSPRGVMLSQRNLASNAAALAEVHGSTDLTRSDPNRLKSVLHAGADQTRLCVLPLSHIYARTCDLYTWLYRGSRLVLAESRETIARDCQLAQPTAVSAVPYLYQRIAEKVRASGAADCSAALPTVFGGRVERLSCGGAPLPPDVDDWYADQGLRVLPGYGLTEASPVVSTSTLASWRRGSVGRPLPNVDVRIAEDGEILVRGPNVMLGYWQDHAATAEAIRDGWLHTGDLGELDADGFLFVRGRKKELIALSTGKKVFPTRVESLLASSPLIEQAAVFGDGHPALVALIVPAACGLAKCTPREAIAAEISRCLQSAAREEQVRDFALLDRPFSVERGELTAKLSLCRDAIARNFAAALAALRDGVAT